ncbi:PREDICTED: transmembrane protein 234 homolog [Camelina sativa]|uniref:Transmembrane protein 234 homolog n=1 Tax=Camelina sativa TaxID=90675 RepID=A0ABM0T4H9_CAMSA|nr:PREDICTED: transmembrane protein 234 homolog [Camelina sativa]XP_010420767.1 PREDICTED: transmembrane protein 234 homolog [Camelina sativa]XP_010420768.1 PREDICTED: transmembrane protein 234 homolog [Camelina sativa]
MKEDMEKMVAVGLVWGATNTLIRRGALAWDKRKSSSTTESSSSSSTLQIRRKIMIAVRDWINLLLFWQYSVPFLVNLSASATFFALLSHAPISLAVPVTNATTFAATAAFGILLGEETQIGPALLGTSFIVFGIWLCLV